MATIRVEVVLAHPDAHESVRLELPEGSTLEEAVRASGLEPGAGKFGIFGKARRPEVRLADGDRVEIYRALSVDPKEARRRRARR